MKTRWIFGVLGTGMLIVSAGCAAHKACPIIPAQLELAEERAQLSQEEYQQASEELDRIQGNVARIEENIAKMEAEKAILLELVGDEVDEEGEE